MKTLIFYDNTGHVYFYTSGNYVKPIGDIKFIEVDDYPTDQLILSVDTSGDIDKPIYGFPTPYAYEQK